jgi:NAD(P)-dependent dehydrogenase (short-subunit alcohol dehydrogenase family)
MKLAGKVAIITGGAVGLGRAFATRLAADGAAVVLADIVDAKEGVAALEASGARALGLRVDVTSTDDLARMVDRTIDSFGRIDILVNNAALFAGIPRRPFDEIPIDEWRRVMEVNVTGAFLAARAVVATMRKQRYGRIVNVSSGTALKGNPWYLHYAVSKGALITMSRALAREVGKDGITVNALAPGMTLSDSVIKARGDDSAHRDAINKTRAIPRDQYPEDLVGAVSFLASDDAAFVTGQTLAVDGGSAMV